MKASKSKKESRRPHVKRSASRDRQLSFDKVGAWGGKRKGAGRPNKTKTVNHMKRPKVSARYPLHLTQRLKDGLPSLRDESLFEEFKIAVQHARKFGLFVNHFSIQGNHLHLIAEAKDNRSLARGMRSLSVRFAKAIRRFAHTEFKKSKKGSVFAGRYHVHVLKTPAETKNALEYVLLNTSKHKSFIEYIDGYSSGGHFRQWKALLGKRYDHVIRREAEAFAKDRDRPLESILSPPKSWLLAGGWAVSSIRASGASLTPT